MRQADWVVYAKRPFAGPQQVLDYVGRYTHRIAISDSRMLDIDDGQVRFRYKNYRDDAPDPQNHDPLRDRIHPALSSPRPPDPLPSHSVLRLPWPPAPDPKLARCRHLLGTASPTLAASMRPADYRDRYETLTGISLRTCPVCHDGHMLLIEHLSRGDERSTTFDSS